MDAAPMLETTALAVAEHLLRMGHASKAAELLVAAATHKSSGISLKTVLALARIFYDARNWGQAAELWRSVRRVDQNHTEALLKLAHCSLELGHVAEAQNLAAALHNTARADARTGPLPLDPWLALIHEQICLHFLNNDVNGAHALVQLAALPGSYAEKVLGQSAETAEHSPLDGKAILQRIRAALDGWSKSGGRCCYRDHLDRVIGGAARNAAPRGKKVILVLRRYFLGTPGSREHELAFFFRRSAEALGMTPVFFAAEPFLNTASVTPDEQYAALDRLARLIVAEEPDLVVCDDLCVPNGSGEYIDRGVYRSVLTDLKARRDFKLVGFYPDAWDPRVVATIEFVRGFADAVWHQNWAIATQRSPREQGQDFFGPTPYEEALFQNSAGAQKEIPAAFAGGLFEYNFPRGIWLTLIKAKGLPCEILLSNHTTTGSAAGSSVEEYARFLSRVGVTVNFSARRPQTKILTGRAWEAILARSVLLEEENDIIPNYFAPFVHYLPFATIGELEAGLRFFQKFPEERNAMAERASRWFQTHFSKERVWSDLIRLLYRNQ